MIEPIAGAKVARQAVASLRGYAYQLLATLSAWIDLSDDAILTLEIAEDYAVVANDALTAVQVKDTYRSGTVTLNTASVRTAIAHFVELQNENPSKQVNLHFLTTSEIGREKSPVFPLSGTPGLRYWRFCAASGAAAPLRQLLEGPGFPPAVRDFCSARNDPSLRRELLQRIHWDCGRPDFSTLRQEVKARLVVLGREQFKLPYADVEPLLDVLLSVVLRKAISDGQSSRVLSRSDLYRAIDEATRVSISRQLWAAIETSVTAAAPAAQRSFDSEDPESADSRWLIDTSALSEHARSIPRHRVAKGVTKALDAHNVCILHGSTGVGKSTVARSVMTAAEEATVLVSFRSLGTDDTRARLELLLPKLGSLRARKLILEDVNTLYDSAVVASAGRVFEVARRRSLTVLLTCYQVPSGDTLAAMSLEPTSVVFCPYFSQAETGLLVEEYDGDRDKWERIAHVLGGYGHPQLVHAFVRGASYREWPEVDIQAGFVEDGPAADMEHVRREARRRLIEGLPRETRTLLYRLSVSTIHFRRSTALSLGSEPPAISDVGEHFDALVGSWLETVGRGLFRVSPLASDFGVSMLAEKESRRLHHALAVETMQHQQLMAADADGIFVHALKGEAEQALVSLAWAVLSTRDSSRVGLEASLLTLRTWPSSRSIYERSAPAAAVLRIAQVKLCMASSEPSPLTELVATLAREIEAVDQPQLRHALEVHSLAMILTTRGIANDLENWVDMLMRARRVADTNPMFKQFARDIERATNVKDGEFLRVLFALGTTNITSVARLESVLERLDEVPSGDRAMWLRPMDGALADYSVFVASPWVAEDNENRLNAADAASRYERMAARTRGWQIPGLSAQCAVAQAVLLDQFQGLKHEALAILDDADASCGGDVVVRRARAGLYYRHEEHERALELFRDVLPEVAAEDPIERTIVFREAAISAGHCGRWAEAENWFVEAQTSARHAPAGDMTVTAIALEADAAAAALMSGNTEGAIRRFAKALEDVDSSDMPDTLRAAYCRRIVPHAIMWCKGVVSGEGFTGLKGEPLVFLPGMCSNFTPKSEIRDHPLVQTDNAWYMLASTEVEARVDAGVGATLSERLRGGPIPVLEAGFRMYRMEAYIEHLDADCVASYLMRYLESAIYFTQNRKEVESNWDAMDPGRGEIPALSDDAIRDPMVESGARGCVLAYAIRALCADRMTAIDELDRAVQRRFGTRAVGQSVFIEMVGEHSRGLGLEGSVIEVIQIFRSQGRPRPETFWGASFCLVRWADQSEFGKMLMRCLAAWLREEWRQVLEEESFQLVWPRITVPEVERVLSDPEDTRTFVLRLLNVTLDAVGVTGRREYRSMIEEMAKGRSVLNPNHSRQHEVG